MSDSLGRFVSLIAPDIAEAGVRAYANRSTPSQSTTPPTPNPRTRAPRNPAATLPSFGKQENTVNTSNPKPEEIQAGLDATLVKFVEDQKTPEKRAEMLIKLGSYQVELSKYMPMLRDADAETAQATLVDWFATGDGEMKKALVNAVSGIEEFPLIKMAPAEGADMMLARMIDALPEGRPRMAMLQKIAFYGTQLDEMLGRGELLKIDPATIEAAVTEWIADGDGTHRELKKAVADAQREARAIMSVNENDAVDEKSGNAASHVGSRLSGQNDHTYAGRSTGAGAGPRIRGTTPAPNQTNAPSPTPGSGPNDTGDGGVNPTLNIRRKGTTGGLGSVAGESGNGNGAAVTDRSAMNTDKGDINPKTGKKKKPAMDKNADLAVELVKIAPEGMIQVLNGLAADDQVDVCQKAAQDAADLMAWSAQQDPNQLQKAALDGAIADWLKGDPDTIQMKKWVAEALATAEEIPLSLGKAIMAYQAPAPLRVRQPFATAA